MRKMINITAQRMAVAAAAVFSLASTAAGAATTTITQHIAFDVAIVLTKNADINFGIVSAMNASTYKVDTAGAVTTTAGTGSWLGGTHAAGNVKITGSTTATIDITVNNYVANNGVTPSLATCSYDGGGEVACNTLAAQTAPGAGAGRILLVGGSVTSDGTQAAATAAAPTFDIIVNYT